LEERSARLAAAAAEFGLTPAEARLLAVLFEGCSVPQAAERLGVARTTARTHLQRVFDKTGARRQGDLMRLVGCA
jgi:DNA-binding CsgD family transcriptional regulator